MRALLFITLFCVGAITKTWSQQVGIMCLDSLDCKGVKEPVTGLTDGCNICSCAPGFDDALCTRMTCLGPQTAEDKETCKKVKRLNDLKMKKVKPDTSRVVYRELQDTLRVGGRK